MTMFSFSFLWCNTVLCSGIFIHGNKYFHLHKTNKHMHVHTPTHKHIHTHILIYPSVKNAIFQKHNAKTCFYPCMVNKYYTFIYDTFMIHWSDLRTTKEKGDRWARGIKVTADFRTSDEIKLLIHAVDWLKNFFKRFSWTIPYFT